MRLRAFKELGIAEAFISIITPENEAQKLKYALSDNDRAASYDEQALTELIHTYKDDIELGDYKVDLGEPMSIGDLLSTVSPEEVVEDEVPEAPKIAKTKTGDLYILGNHRLLCGDATKKEDVDKLMAGQKADMVFTDPPYGVAYADKNKYLNTIARGNRIQTEIQNDHKDINDLKNNIIFPAFCRIKETLNNRSSYYITAPQGGDLLMMMMMMMKAGLPLRHMIIWVKNNHVLGRTDYNYKHEPLLFGWDEVHDFYGKGKHKFSTWEIDKPHKSDLHPTMKPIELIANALLNSTLKEMNILDLFGGSGSTLIACEQLNRKCFMMEIDPLYVSVILERWENFTGKKAVLNGK